MIRMPLVDGEIQAACKTEGELAKEISWYARYYRNLPVDVFIKEYHAREVALHRRHQRAGTVSDAAAYSCAGITDICESPSEKAGQTINIVRAPRTDVWRASR